MIVDDADDLQWLYCTVSAAVRERELDKRPVTPRLRNLATRLKTELAVARTRQAGLTDTSCWDDEEPHELLSAREAATALGCPLRTVQRHAELWGAQKVSGCLVFGSAAIAKAAEALNHD